MADLRTELAALADKWQFERAGYPVATDLRALAAETAVRLCEDEVRALLASSAPATASEGATEDERTGLGGDE